MLLGALLDIGDSKAMEQFMVSYYNYNMCSLVTCVGNTLLTFAADVQLITMHLWGSEILPLSVHCCLSVLPPLQENSGALC